MMNRRRRSLGRKQHGFLLIALLALLAMGGLYFFISNLTPEAIATLRKAKTDAALVQAREALIGYALQYREQQKATDDPAAMYGYLPLPDFGESVNLNAALLNQPCTSEGCAKVNAAGITGSTVLIGRFPWKTVGTGPLRDGYGECLWYAISATHRAVNSTATTMNWDTLAIPDVVIGSGSATLAAINAHERPIAVIFSAGAAFSSGRTTSNDAPDCGGNYDVTHYVDAALNNAQRSLPVTSDMLFSTLRKSTVRPSPDIPSRPPSFRDDIGDMLDRITECARDQIVSGSIAANGKVADECSIDLDAFGPRGYYSNYRDQVFVAKCSACQVTVDSVAAPSCAGALLFGNQRGSGQNRRIPTEIADWAYYLEGDNLTNFNSGGNTYAGPSKLMPVPAQSLGQDIVRCIPAGKSLADAPSALPAGTELTAYDAATRTLTLGRQNIESDLGYAASALFGCAWTPEAHGTGSGVRGYFKFRIEDTGTPGEGFTFAAVDGDRNGATVCGAAVQHLGYSGNNGVTPIIAHPKLAVEFDTRRNYVDGSPYGFSDPVGFDPGYLLSSPISTSHLNNGRADPDYAGGHMAIVYWGVEADIFSDRRCEFSTCPSPMFCKAVTSPPTGFAAGSYCHLNPEEDDNIHGRTATLPASRPYPRNPVAQAAVPTPPTGVYKLDPSLSQVPHNDIHVRVEIDRVGNAGRDDHAKRVRVVASSNLALSGLPTIDTIPLATGNRVLVVGQSDARQNGVWIAAAGAWARAATENEGLEFPVGSSWFVNEGSAYRGSLWRLQNTDPIVTNTSLINIARYRDPVRAVATTNRTRSGLQTVDGVSLVGGDRVLLTAQSTPSENGVYSVAGGTWSRAILENTSAGMKAGATWYVREGGNAGRFWHTTADANPGGGAAINISLITAASNTIYFSTVTTQVWKLPESPTTANQIAKMKLTSSPLALLDASHQPLLSDTMTVYDLRGATCTSALTCASGQFCGIDNNCYSPAFRTMRLGFTNSQSTRDQVINITDFTTTWLP